MDRLSIGSPVELLANGLEAAPIGSVARLSGDHSSVATRAAISERVDGCSCVLAEPGLAKLLSGSGIRVPVLPISATESEINSAVADFEVGAVPKLENRKLIANGALRRHVRFPPSTIGEQAALDAQIAMVLQGLEPAHAQYGSAHARRFGQTLALVPSAPEGGTLLELSSFPITTRILTDAGYWCASTVRNGGEPFATESNPFDAQFGRKVEIEADIETQKLACEDALFDVVMACEIIEHLPRDPMQLLVEANRVLRTGGKLIVTTPNIVGEHAIGASLVGDHPANYYFFERSGSLDRHHFEWTPALLGSAIRSAGFAVDHLETYFSWWDSDPAVAAKLDEVGHPRHLRGDNIIATATKVSPLIDRTPDDLYVGEGRSTVVSYTAKPRIT